MFPEEWGDFPQLKTMTVDTLPLCSLSEIPKESWDEWEKRKRRWGGNQEQDGFWNVVAFAENKD